MTDLRHVRGPVSLARGIVSGVIIAAIAISVLVLLGGCATKPRVVVSAKPACPVVKPVCIGKDDVLTEETAQQLEANELGRSKICGPPPKCKKA